MENRPGLFKDFTVSLATSIAAREAMQALADEVRERRHQIRLLSTERGYDTQDCVQYTRDQGAARTSLADQLVATGYNLVPVANLPLGLEAGPAPSW